MKNMYKIGNGLKLILEIGNGGGGVVILGGNRFHASVAICCGTNTRKKYIYYKWRE
jgi:hypothetical protein